MVSLVKRYEYLEKLSDIIENKLQFIFVRINGMVNAFSIFETLNHRGLPLTVESLTKNSLFEKAGKLTRNNPGETRRLEGYIESKWAKLHDKIPDEKNERSYFLLRYWNSKHKGKETMKKVYGKIYNELKESVNDTTQFEDYISDIIDHAELYEKYWLKPNVSDFRNEKLYYDLMWLKKAGIKQHIPLLLSCGDSRINEELIERFLKLVETLFVLHFVVKGGSPSAVETKLTDWAFEMRKAGIDHNVFINDLKDKSKEFIGLSRTAIKERFENISVKESSRVQLILRRIELHLNDRDVDYFKNTDNLWVEHILPKTMGQLYWNDYWTSLQHEQFLNRLGNLTLLYKPDNIRVGNKPYYPTKVRDYARSSLSISNSEEIWGAAREKNTQVWNKHSVIERQQALAEIAVNIWDIDLI